MSEQSQTEAGAAREALTRAGQVGAATGRAARRQAGFYMSAMGVAMAVGLVLTGLINQLNSGGLRAAVIAVVWGSVFGGVTAVVNNRHVRVAPARRPAVVVAVLSLVVIGVTEGVSRASVVGHVIGALILFAVWALGAAWVRR